MAGRSTTEPREVVWWALRYLAVDEWIVSVIRAMYEDATTKVRLNGRESKAFSVKVGVPQGSVLTLLLFIIVLEALSREFREGLPMELLHADDPVLMAESKGWKQRVLEWMLVRQRSCSVGWAGFRVRILEGTHVVSVGKEVQATQILCVEFLRWVHKRCRPHIGKNV